jgi:hypothetical protein
MNVLGGALGDAYATIHQHSSTRERTAQNGVCRIQVPVSERMWGFKSPDTRPPGLTSDFELTPNEPLADWGLSRRRLGDPPPNVITGALLGVGRVRPGPRWVSDNLDD